MKKLIILILVFATSLLSSALTFAENQAIDPEFNELIQKYNLTVQGNYSDTTSYSLDTSTTLDKSNYIVFDSVKEAEKWLANLRKTCQEVQNVNIDLSNSQNNIGIMAYAPISEDRMSTVTMQVGKPLPYYMNINIKYNVSLLYTPPSVNSVLNVTSYLSGFTMGMQWTQIDWVSNRFARPNGGYGATGSVNGLYTFNLIIKDIPVSGSEPLTYGFTIN